MRDIHVEISIGTAVIGIMVYQGTKSPHTPIGVRVLANSWIPRGEPAHSRSVDDILAMVGRHLAKLDLSERRLNTDPQLPLEPYEASEKPRCAVAGDCEYRCANLEEHESIPPRPRPVKVSRVG